jgi:hypothetical protein
MNQISKKDCLVRCPEHARHNHGCPICARVRAESSCWHTSYECKRCGALLVTNGVTYWCSDEKCIIKPVQPPPEKP